MIKLIKFIFGFAETVRGWIIAFGASLNWDLSTAAAVAHFAAWVVIILLFAKILIIALCLVRAVINLIKSLLKTRS